MWFKNLRLYCLTQEFTLTPEELAAKLASFQFQPCSSYDRSRIGWISPVPASGQEDVVNEDGEVVEEAGEPPLTLAVGGYILLCAQYQERWLPASVVRDATEEKVAELEHRQARKVYRKEKRQIQEDMEAQLLPQAFTRNQQIYAYLAPQDNLLVVNAASAPRAEELVNLLRDTLGSLPVALPDTKRSPSAVMTSWLQAQKASDHFHLDEDCELYNPLDGSNVIRCKGQDLTGDEIVAHLEAGKQVKSLGVSWNNLLACVISDDLVIKRLRFEEMQEESASFAGESAAQKMDQEFALMTLELSNFFKSLFKAFGGLAPPKSSGED
jgi:recombination associated protein RdgC